MKPYLVSIDDDARASIAELIARLQDEGFVVVTTLETIGVITGQAEEADVPRIREVAGVAAVEEDRQTGLPS